MSHAVCIVVKRQNEVVYDPGEPVESKGNPWVLVEDHISNVILFNVLSIMSMLTYFVISVGLLFYPQEYTLMVRAAWIIGFGCLMWPILTVQMLLDLHWAMRAYSIKQTVIEGDGPYGSTEFGVALPSFWKIFVWRFTEDAYCRCVLVACLMGFVIFVSYLLNAILVDSYEFELSAGIAGFMMMFYAVQYNYTFAMVPAIIVEIEKRHGASLKRPPRRASAMLALERETRNDLQVTKKEDEMKETHASFVEDVGLYVISRSLEEDDSSVQQTQDGITFEQLQEWEMQAQLSEEHKEKPKKRCCFWCCSCTCCYMFIVICFMCEAVMHFEDSYAYPMPGIHVEVPSGRMVHILCEGEKFNEDDAIVGLVHGFTANSMRFALIHNVASKFAKVCAVDTDTNWSHVSNRRATNENLAEDIMDAFRIATGGGKMVLLGYSRGAAQTEDCVSTERAREKDAQSIDIVGVLLMDGMDLRNMWQIPETKYVPPVDTCEGWQTFAEHFHGEEWREDGYIGSLGPQLNESLGCIQWPKQNAVHVPDPGVSCGPIVLKDDIVHPPVFCPTLLALFAMGFHRVSPFVRRHFMGEDGKNDQGGWSQNLGRSIDLNLFDFEMAKARNVGLIAGTPLKSEAHDKAYSKFRLFVSMDMEYREWQGDCARNVKKGNAAPFSFGNIPLVVLTASLDPTERGMFTLNHVSLADKSFPNVTTLQHFEGGLGHTQISLNHSSVVVIVKHLVNLCCGGSEKFYRDTDIAIKHHPEASNSTSNVTISDW